MRTVASRPPTRRVRRGFALLVGVGFVVAAPLVAGVLRDLDPAVAAPVAVPSTGDVVTVERVVDGDTIVVNRGGQTIRVRLVNVDAPESVHPTAPVECGGAEASAWLTARLPVGTHVTLVHDVDRYDRFGREIAAVFDGPDLVNVELAYNGWATPVIFGSNQHFYPAIAAASQQARDRQRGVFDPALGCTTP